MVKQGEKINYLQCIPENLSKDVRHGESGIPL